MVQFLRSGQRSSRFLSHWTYTTIRDKISDICDLSGIKFVESSNVYRSQRCSHCGFVHKSNRKGKGFVCRHCGFTYDADINSALNHQADLVELPFGIRHLKLNKSGFFWKEFGLFDINDQELIVPDVSKF